MNAFSNLLESTQTESFAVTASEKRLRENLEWTGEMSSELYRVDRWGEGFFRVSESGDLEVRLPDESGEIAWFSLRSIAVDLAKFDIQTPVLLRFPALLHERIDQLVQGFATAIAETGYQNVFRGVYPIKVNQRAEVVEEIAHASMRHQYGLEVGSRTELLVAIPLIGDPNSFLICNGYKDRAYIELALTALKSGQRLVIVLEMPGELEEVLEIAETLGVEPILGARVRLGYQGSGRWSSTVGEQGLFGLNPLQLLEAVDFLKTRNRLNCLKMLHYHQGSQISTLSQVKAAAREAAVVYSQLVKEGATMGYLNAGGGLGIDYDGSYTAGANSINYRVEEYCLALVESLKEVFEKEKTEHPLIVAECGRGVAAHYSALVFNIIDVTRADFSSPRQTLEEKSFADTTAIREMREIAMSLPQGQMMGDALARLAEIRQKIRIDFREGNATLRECGTSDHIYFKAIKESEQSKLASVSSRSPGVSDFLYANFSVFQSLPDHWALGQFFPVMPIGRLNEEPTRQGVVADLTCDSDGKVKSYIHHSDHSDFLPVHYFDEGEDYFMGAFLVGAYQETLGDMHNLFGTTHVVSCENRDGAIHFSRRERGDTAREILGWLEYDVDSLEEKVAERVSAAVEDGRMTEEEKKRMIEIYRDSLEGYSYLKD